MKDIQNRKDALLKKVDVCSDYFSKSTFAPAQVVEVKVYKYKFEKSLKLLDSSQVHFENAFMDYTSKINQYLAINATSKPQNCEDLKTDLEKFKSYMQSMKEARIAFQNDYDEFSSKTTGMDTIHSCSTNWPIVMEADASLQNIHNKTNAIQIEWQIIANHIQMLVKY